MKNVDVEICRPETRISRPISLFIIHFANRDFFSGILGDGSEKIGRIIEMTEDSSTRNIERRNENEKHSKMK